jgi:hypothetical protein
MSMNNLGLSYLRQSRYDDAERILRETIGLEAKVRGAHHPSTLETRYNLACVLARAGRSREALGEVRAIVADGFRGAYIVEDSDLASLRGEPEFDALAAEVVRRSKQP